MDDLFGNFEEEPKKGIFSKKGTKEKSKKLNNKVDKKAKKQNNMGQKQTIQLKEFKSEKRKAKFRIIMLAIFIWALLMSVAFLTFLKPKKIANAKQLLVQNLEKINILSYTDVDGFKALTDKINMSTLESNTKITLDGTKIDEIQANTLPFDKLLFNIDSKVDNNQNKYKSDIDIKMGETTLLKFELLDDGKNIGIQSNDFFKEYLGIEKASIKTVIDNLNEQSINIADDPNNIKEYLNKVVNSNYKVNIYTELTEIEKKYNEFLRQEISSIDDKSFNASTKVPTKYKNKDIKVDNINISLNKKQYVEIMKKTYDKTIDEIKNNKEKYVVCSTFVEEAEKKLNTDSKSKEALTSDRELNKQLKQLNPLNQPTNQPKNQNNQMQNPSQNQLNTGVQGNSTRQQTGIVDPLAPPQPFSKTQGNANANGNANVNNQTKPQVPNTNQQQPAVNPQNPAVPNAGGINPGGQNTQIPQNTQTTQTTQSSEVPQNKNSILKQIEEYLVPEESKLKEQVNIRIYMISKQDFKVDIYDQNKEDNVEEKILTFQISKEKNVKEMGIENYLLNKKIIFKTTEDENNAYTNVEIKKQENKTENTQNIDLTPQEDKLMLEVTRKKTNTSDAFKKIKIEKLKAGKVFRVQMENNIHFKDNVLIQTDKPMQLLNTLSATDLDNLISKVVFPQVKKVLKQKRFIMQNLANAKGQINNTQIPNNNNANNKQTPNNSGGAGNTNEQVNKLPNNINNVNVR